MKRLFLTAFLTNFFSFLVHASTIVTIKSIVGDGTDIHLCMVNELTGLNEPFVNLKPGTTTTFNVNSATFLMDVDNMIPVLVYAGEVLNVDVSFGHLPIFKSIDNNEKRNNELSFFLDCYRKEKNIRWTYGLFRIGNQPFLYISNKYIAQTVADSKSTLNKRISFLNSYRSANQISPQFYQYISDYFNYLYDFDLLRPADYIGIYASDLPKNLKDCIREERERLKNAEQLNNIGFLKACQSLSTYECLDVTYRPYCFKLCYKRLSDGFTGKVRRYLLFNLLIKYMQLLPTGYSDFFEGFINETNDIYSAYLKERRDSIAGYKNEASNKLEIIDTEGKFLSFNQLVKMYEGELIYLDVWASWCAPCRKNIPFVRKIEQKLASNHFKVVYLSVDEDKHKWKQAIQQEHLDKRDCFLLDSEKVAVIIKRFRIAGIPRYILIGKDGNIITTNPIYPYQPHAEQIFSNYLKTN